VARCTGASLRQGCEPPAGLAGAHGSALKGMAFAAAATAVLLALGPRRGHTKAAVPRPASTIPAAATRGLAQERGGAALLQAPT
jgi:hypothetical protein